MPDPSSVLFKVIGKSLPVQVFSLLFVMAGLLGDVLSILISVLFSSEMFPAISITR